MKRRTAIKSLIVSTTAATLLPACNLFQEPLKVYSNLPLDREQRTMIAHLANTILPTKDLKELSSPESTLDFILTMINDSYPKEDIETYLSGVTGFQPFLKEKYHTTLTNLQPDQFKDLLTNISTNPEIPEEIKSFFNTTTQLTKRHFTTSEYYLKNFTDWEFAPGRYDGCVAINQIG